MGAPCTLLHGKDPARGAEATPCSMTTQNSQYETVTL